MENLHNSVMINEIISFLPLKKSINVIDATFGGGGYSKTILEKFNVNQLLAIDRDPISKIFAKELESKFSNFTLINDKFSKIEQIVNDTNLKDKTKSFVNAAGSIFLGISTCIAILFVGFNGKQSIINSPILNFEITQTGSVGMFVKYQLAAFLGIFAISMLVQFVSYYFSSLSKMNALKES